VSTQGRIIVNEHIKNARQAMAAKRFDDAIRSISAALLVDSSNQEALGLAITLGELEEQSRLDSIAQRQPESQSNPEKVETTRASLPDTSYEPAWKQKGEVQEASEGGQYPQTRKPSDSINGILLIARRYLERGKLDEALEEVSAGMEISPSHPELLWLRNTILEERKILKSHVDQLSRPELLHKIRELFARTEFSKALDEIRTVLQQFPDDVEILNLKAEVESSLKKWQELKQFEDHSVAVNEHVRNARQLMKLEQLDDAASEIALGLVLAPYNHDLKKLEKELWEAQAKLEEMRLREEEERRKAQEFVKLKLHLLAAEEFAKHSEFGKALDEIVQAYLVDPTDVEAKRLEVRVRQLQQRAAASPLKLVYKNEQSTQAQ
jgi:hypothetical protein